MEVVASRFLYVAAILCTRLCDYHYSFIKAVRRRLSAPHRGIVLEISPANLPPSAVGLGERLRHSIESNRKRNIKPTEKASAAIINYASLRGWGAVFIPDSGDVKIAGGDGRGKPFLIMQAEARAVRLALSAFSAILPCIAGVWVRDALLRRAAKKGSSKSPALTWELQRIYEFFGLSRSTGVLCLRAVCRKPRRRHITRSRFYTAELGEGDRRGRVAERTPKPAAL
ncbi:putative target of rapamycin (TOR) kinase 1 [Trypanosoma cruzi]|nr:putative target of rapamycin (TOR) kinase 1 [Trypanosoma cruzi]